MPDPLTELVQNFRVADALDVAVVSFILYALISWLRRSASRRIVAACVLIGAVYLVASSLGMYLTTVLLQALAAVAVLATLIVFQADIQLAGSSPRLVRVVAREAPPEAPK